MKKCFRIFVCIFVIITIIFNNIVIYANEIQDFEEKMIAEQYFDIFNMLRISGDEESGYYYEFKNNALNDLQEIFDSYQSIFRSANINSVDILKEFIKAQATSELPNLGGIVSGTNEISNGKETTIKGKSKLQVASYDNIGNINEGSDSSSNSDGSIVWPVAGMENAKERGEGVISLYGYRGLGADSANNGIHTGIDIVCTTGTEIYAVADGVIKSAGAGKPDPSAGNGVLIDHGEVNGKTFLTLYAHNSQVFVKDGDQVKKGDLIAYAGATGNAYGPHLHFETWYNSWWGVDGESFDPLEIFSSDYVSGRPCNVQGKRGTNSSFSVSSSGGSTKANVSFASTKDTTKALNNLLNNEITVSKDNSRFNQDRINGGVILRRIVPNRNFGDKLNNYAKEYINYENEYEGMGTFQEIPAKMASKIGISSPEYSLLYIPYIDFNENVKTGKMIIKTEYANEVLQLFYQLYANKYPIEKINLPQQYEMQLDDDSIPYSAIELSRIKELAFIKEVDLPNEDSGEYTSFMNNIFEESYIYFEEFMRIKNEEMQISTDKYDSDGNFNVDYKKYLTLIKEEYYSFKSDDKNKDIFQSKTNEFEKKKEEVKNENNNCINRTKNIEGLENKIVQDNNTYGYLSVDDGANKGISFTINPYFNPKMQNEIPIYKDVPEKYGLAYGDSNVLSQSEIEYKFSSESEFIETSATLYWQWEGQTQFTKDGNGDEVQATNEILNLGRFTRKEEERKEKQEKLMDTIVYDLSYVPYKTFNSYLQEGDSRVQYCYTIGPDGFIYTSIWEYTKDKTGEKFKYKVSNPISFYDSLYKYEMNVEYLIAMLSVTQDSEFMNNFANLGSNSTYIMAIEDIITQKKTTNIDTGEESITETSSQIQEILYVNNWFTKYVKCLVPSEKSDLYSPLFITEPFNINNLIVSEKVTTSKNVLSSSGDYVGQAKYSSDIIKEAAAVHKIMEDKRFTYSQTDSDKKCIEDAVYNTVVCSTYVDWVLYRLGLKLPSRLCSDLMVSLPQEDWVEIVDEKDRKPGDMFLTSTHINIFGGYVDGVPSWYDAGANEAIQNQAPIVAPWPDHEAGVVFRIKDSAIENPEKYFKKTENGLVKVGNSSSSSSSSKSSLSKKSSSNSNLDLSKLQFIGDSWIVGMLQYASDGIFDMSENYMYGAVGKSSLSSEMNFDTVLANIQKDCSAIVCNLGLNGANEQTAIATAQLLEKLAKELKKPIFQLKTPHVGTKYYYFSLSADDVNKNIDIYNKKLEEEISKIDGVELIDATKVITDENGYLKNNFQTDDGLHLNSKLAYKTYYDEIIKLITSGDYGSRSLFKSETLTFTYTNAKCYTTGNSSKFEQLYRHSSEKVKSNLHGYTIFDLLTTRSSTFASNYTTRYLLYQANKENYGSTTLCWSEYYPDEFKKKKKKERYQTDIDEKLLFACGIMWERACEGSYDLGDCYACVDIHDGAGNTAAFGLTYHVIGMLQDYIDENYPNFPQHLSSGRVPKQEAQDIFVKVLEYARDAIVGKDNEGGDIKDPSDLTQNQLNALIDMHHNKGNINDVAQIYNEKKAITTDEFEAAWGTATAFEAGLRRRSRNRGYLFNEDRWVDYTSLIDDAHPTGQDFDFDSETPWSDFIDGTPSTELYHYTN